MKNETGKAASVHPIVMFPFIGGPMAGRLFAVEEERDAWLFPYMEPQPVDTRNLKADMQPTFENIAYTKRRFNFSCGKQVIVFALSSMTDFEVFADLLSKYIQET